MKKSLLFGLLAAVSVAAQVKTETIPFRVIANSMNEVPALPAPNSTGNVTVLMHLSRNAAGDVVAGSVDFRMRYRLGQATTITMMHIHRGASGVAGPVVDRQRPAGADRECAERRGDHPGRSGAIRGDHCADQGDPGQSGRVLREYAHRALAER